VFSTLLPAFIILAAVAGLAAIVLSLASKKFRVEQDPRVAEILEALPGANCGGCGFAGCGAFAESTVAGQEPLCPVADETANKIVADIMGTEVKQTEPTTARVMCSGTSDHTAKTAKFQGVIDCRAATTMGRSEKPCQYSCYGFGTCAAVCPFDAIEIKDGVAIINTEKCTSCGKCIKACPQEIIKIVPSKKTTTISCSSHDKGAIAMKKCKVSCIGCTKCVKECPVQAISMVNFLAVIDYTKCVNCKKCIPVCPKKAIREVV
jgi:electron transport complex protein RnfB